MVGLIAVVLVLGATAMVLAQQASDTAKAAKKAAAPLVAKRAQEALLPFKKSLKGTLMAAIKDGGPLSALSACQVKAPKLTAAAAQAGVEVGRTSHKVRNPKNAPEKWVRKALARYIGKKKGDGEMEPYVVKMLPDGRAAYAEPIFTGGVCLTCHGENLAAPVQKALKVAYPEDQAVGFKAGEFRGLFWAILTPDAVKDAREN